MITDTTLTAIQKQFRRLKWQCDAWERAEWRLTLEEYISLWADRWRERRTLKLVLLRRDESKPYEIGNVFIDTRSNQVKRMWEEYRKNASGRQDAVRAADERALARQKLRDESR